VAPLEMNAGTCWGKNTIDLRGSVEKAPGSDFNLFNLLVIIPLQKPFMYTMCVSTITSVSPVLLLWLIFQKIRRKAYIHKAIHGLEV
jgi:hypothetical protein